MSFNAFTAGEVAADAPLDTDFATKIKDNFDAIHDGTDIVTDLVTQASIAAAAVGVGELKHALETVGVNLSPVAGARADVALSAASGLGHKGQVQTNGLNVDAWLYAPNAAFGCGARFYRYALGTLAPQYIQSYYHSASPPYPFMGSEDWGLWLYLALDGADRVLRAWVADDPPGYQERAARLRDGYGRYDERLCKMLKRHPLLHTARPHPFLGCWGYDENNVAQQLPAGGRVVLVDLRALEQDDPNPWRPDVDAYEATMAEALSLPMGSDERKAMHAYLVDLARAKEERDAEIAKAEEDLGRAPGSVEDLASLMADREVETLERSRAILESRITKLDAMLEDEKIPARREVELFLLRKETRAAAKKLVEKKIPEAKAGRGDRLAKARLEAEEAFPVIRRRLRARAGILTRRQRLQMEANATPSGLLRSLVGGSGGESEVFHLGDKDVKKRVEGDTPMHDAVDAALGGIPADSAIHPNHDEAKKIPGLFIPKSQGERPLVTILSPR